MTDGAPLRGEIWWVDLDPTLGSEVSKTRPAVVVSSSALVHVPLRLIVPFTTWRPHFGQHRNKVVVRPTAENGLRNSSAADVLQLRTVSLVRFGARLGRLEALALRQVVAALALAVDWEQSS